MAAQVRSTTCARLGLTARTAVLALAHRAAPAAQHLAHRAEVAPTPATVRMTASATMAAQVHSTTCAHLARTAQIAERAELLAATFVSAVSGALRPETAVFRFFKVGYRVDLLSLMLEWLKSALSRLSRSIDGPQEFAELPELPEMDEREFESFDQFALGLCVRNVQRLSLAYGLVFVAAIIAARFAPEGSHPRGLGTVLLVVQGSICFIGSWLVRRWRQPMWITGICFGAVGVIAGYSVSQLGGLDGPAFYGAYVLPTMAIVFPCRLSQRVAVTIALVLPFLFAYFGTHPEYLSHRLIHVPLMWVSATFLTSLAIGHWMRGMIRDRFHLLNVLNKHRATLRAQNLLLDKQVLQKSASIEKLQVEMLSIEDDVKGKIARNIHDDLGQLIVGARMEVENLEEIAGGKEDLQYLSGLLDRMSHATRQLVTELRWSTDREGGIQQAIDDLVAPLRRRGKPRVTLDVDDTLELPDPVASLVFRMVQEAITNTLKHANAESLLVSATEAEHKLHVLVEDDGVGFSEGSGNSGWGLLGLRERAKKLNAELIVQSGTGGGTVVELVVPLLN